MAGETPDASRIGKQRAKKTGKRLTHLDEKKTDKYYASGNPSVINNSPADTRGNAAAKPQANNVGFGALDERSADKKYYKERVPSGQKPMARHLAKALQAQPSAREVQAVSELTIRTGVDVNPVMDEVVRRLQNGDPNVIIAVSAAAMRRARAKLDTLVTRELITEEQSRDVRFSRLSDVEAEAPPVPPVPAETVAADADDVSLSIDDVLSGKTTLEDGPSVEPQDVHEVDDVDDVDAAPDTQSISVSETSANEMQSLHEEEAEEAAADPLDEEAADPLDEADDDAEDDDVLSPEDSEEASDADDAADEDVESDSDE